MTSNVFLVSPRLTEEDRFTAHWHYLLSTCPELAQRVFDHVATAAGLQPTRCVRVVDHPLGSADNRPDFMFEGEAFNIVFEHKLFSPLGERQLERYLQIVRDHANPTYLALASARATSIPPAVLKHERYVRPTHGPAHFTWQGLSQLLSAEHTPLIREFVDYMAELGLTFTPWGDLGDPFIDDEAAEALRAVLRAAAEENRRPGCRIRHSPVKFGMEFGKPLPHIHLIYFSCVKDTDADAQVAPAGRAMRASVWTHPEDGNEILPPFEGVLPDTQPEISVRYYGNVYAVWNPEVKRERLYSAPLRELLAGTQTMAERRISAFIAAVLGHLEAEAASAGNAR